MHIFQINFAPVSKSQYNKINLFDDSLSDLIIYEYEQQKKYSCRNVVIVFFNYN